jgi:phosphoribosyl-ATP pyrophosphohydrolase
MAKSDKRKDGEEKRGSATKAKRLAGKTKKSAKGALPPSSVPASSMPAGPSDSAVLDRLWTVVLSRRDADPSVSHSARLLSRGSAKVAQKFGEEAVECLIEAVNGNHDALVAESADVLYHLIVMWVAAGVEPAEVWAELVRREGVSGIAEKAARPRDLPVAPGSQNRKIP